MTSGANPVNVKKGIDKTCEYLVKKLKERSKPVKGTGDIRAVASISAGNDDTIGKMIADAIDKARPIIIRPFFFSALFWLQPPVAGRLLPHDE